MDMRKDIVRTRNRKEEGTSNSAKARKRLRDQLMAKGVYTKVEKDSRICSIIANSQNKLQFVNSILQQ